METYVIGPPEVQFGGMNDTFRRQQLPANLHRALRNVRLYGEALTRRKGMVRLHSCSRTSNCLVSSGSDGDLVEIPITDTSAITEYNLGTKFTIFAAYSIQNLDDDCMVATHSTVSPPWRIVHNTNGKFTATVTDAASTTATITTAANYGEVNVQYQVQLVRDGTTVTLYVNGTSAGTATTLSATANTLVSAESMYLMSWSGRATGSQMTFYEFRIHREAITDHEWRVTQYPITGRFGDPRLILHLLFEEGSGSALVDYSRVNNSTITFTGTTWGGSSPRQVVTNITGLHVMTNAVGRTWLLVDAGKNHYRIPWN